MAEPTRATGSVPAPAALGAPAGAPAGAAAAATAPTPFNFKSVLEERVRRNAPALPLKVGRPPPPRVRGALEPLQLPAMRPEDLKSLAEQVMTPKQVKEFAEFKETDF